jgi:hypothetical protein
MMSRAFRPIAATLSLLLLCGAPTHAAPVAISQVIQVIGGYQNPPELRLRTVSQNTSTLVADGDGASPVTSTAQQSAAAGVDVIPDNSTGDIATANTADTVLAGVAVSSEPQAGVDVVDQGEVEGTICDCGEITVPGGGFPKWPLLFLAAIPFFFIHGCDHCETPTPPTPPRENPSRQFDVCCSCSFDDQKARLDNLAVDLQTDPSTTTYVIAYGGRTSRIGQADLLGARARDYLVAQRGIDQSRIVVLNGGFREEDCVELWIVPRGATPPLPTPTVQAGDVRPAAGAAASPTRRRAPRRRGRR